MFRPVPSGTHSPEVDVHQVDTLLTKMHQAALEPLQAFDVSAWAEAVQHLRGGLSAGPAELGPPSQGPQLAATGAGEGPHLATARGSVEDLFSVVHASCVAVGGEGAGPGTGAVSEPPPAGPGRGGSGPSESPGPEDGTTPSDTPRTTTRVKHAMAVLGSCGTAERSLSALVNFSSSPVFPCPPGCTRLTHGYLRPLHRPPELAPAPSAPASRGASFTPMETFKRLVEGLGAGAEAGLRVDLGTLSSQGDHRHGAGSGRTGQEAAAVLGAAYSLAFAGVVRYACTKQR
jgi:hypothetical protein